VIPRRPGTTWREQIPADLRGEVDLADRRMGAGVVAANDETFADKENLVQPHEPVFEPHTFGHKGQVYDGWETRRRREPGADWVVVRLGAPGEISAVVVDTAHFTGNFPPECELHACWAPGWPSSAELADDGVGWTPLVPRSELAGDSRTVLRPSRPVRATHVRLTIHPDGGVARLRVLGAVVPDPSRWADVGLDLAALVNGGRVVDCSDRFYSSADHVILPGSAASMGDGWETRRRRGEGNDWLLLRLAGAGRVRVVEVDTTHFVGNAPGAVRVSGCAGDPSSSSRWVELLPRTPLQPDTPHWFTVDDGQPTVDHVRVDVYPDGGLARVRMLGHLTEPARAAVEARWRTGADRVGGPVRPGGAGSDR
jgi:allantoicase